VVVTATTLLLKWYARVHDWASKGTSLGGRARLSSWLFSLLRCKMSLILPKRLHSVTSLRVIGVGFQLYGQLKKSPHDVTGVLGSSPISTASQTTRLDKGSSVTTRDECMS